MDNWYIPITIIPGIGLLILSTSNLMVALSTEINTLIHNTDENDVIINKKLIQLKFPQLPENCIEELSAQITLKSYSKNEILVKQGQYAKTAYLILEGMARAFYYVEEKDVTDWFAFENELICPIVSFFSEKKSPHYIQVLQNSIVVELKKETAQRCHSYWKILLRGPHHIQSSYF